MSPIGFDSWTSRIVNHALPTELKEMSTNAVSRGGYEPTTVCINLDRGDLSLQLYSFYIMCFRPDYI
jgi:hypothetical protein